MALVFCGGTAAARAETGIEGRVINAQSGAPIAGAQVTLMPGTHVACTNADGRYRLVGLPLREVDPSAHVLVRRAGYAPASIQLSLAPGAVQRGDAILRSASGAAASRVTACAPRRDNAAFGHGWVFGRVVDAQSGALVRSGQVVVARGDVRWSGRLDADGFYGIDIGNGGSPQGGNATVQLVGSGHAPISVYVLPGFHTVADMFGDGRSDTRRASPQARPRPPSATRAPRERARPRARTGRR